MKNIEFGLGLVAFDKATGEPQIVRCFEDDGEVRVALLAGSDLDLLARAIERMYGKEI